MITTQDIPTTETIFNVFKYIHDTTVPLRMFRRPSQYFLPEVPVVVVGGGVGIVVVVVVTGVFLVILDQYHPKNCDLEN